MKSNAEIFEKVAFRKSEKSASNGQCVEVAHVDDLFGIRDSKHPSGPVLVFNGAEWDAFKDGVINGEFD